MGSNSKGNSGITPMRDLGGGSPWQSSGHLQVQSVAQQAGLNHELEALPGMDIDGLRLLYRQLHRKTAPAHLPRGLLMRIIAYRMQALALGDLDPETVRYLDRIARGKKKDGVKAVPGEIASTGQSGPEGTNVAPVPHRLRPGTQLVREHKGALHRVIVMERGFSWNGRVFTSLSEVARTITGTSWNGPAFFGLRSRKGLPVAQSAEGAGKSGVSP